MTITNKMCYVQWRIVNGNMHVIVNCSERNKSYSADIKLKGLRQMNIDFEKELSRLYFDISHKGTQKKYILKVKEEVTQEHNYLVKLLGS